MHLNTPDAYLHLLLELGPSRIGKPSRTFLLCFHVSFSFLLSRLEASHTLFMFPCSPVVKSVGVSSNDAPYVVIVQTAWHSCNGAAMPWLLPSDPAMASEHTCIVDLWNAAEQVAQLAGYVSEHSAYHHGEVSLQGTIVGLAQSFVGSNNINLLYPSGTAESARFQGSLWH